MLPNMLRNINHSETFQVNVHILETTEVYISALIYEPFHMSLDCQSLEQYSSVKSLVVHLL